jgi:lipoate-protein ligase B
VRVLWALIKDYLPEAIVFLLVMSLNLKESKALPAIWMFQEQMSSLLLFPNLYKVLIGSFGENVRTILVVSHGVALNIDMEWKRWKMAG